MYAPPEYTCVVTVVSRLRVKNDGEVCVAQVVDDEQIRSNGTSGHDAAVLDVRDEQSVARHRSATVNATCCGAGAAVSEPLRWP